jgi:hypothetical protein
MVWKVPYMKYAFVYMKIREKFELNNLLYMQMTHWHGFTQSKNSITFKNMI